MKKNVHVLVTNKKSKVYWDHNEKKLMCSKTVKGQTVFRTNNHIYITSDEEIEDGIWAYYRHPISGGDLITKIINKRYSLNNPAYEVHHTEGYGVIGGYQKVIMTTDPKLIEDGVREMTHEHIEWFIASCDAAGCIIKNVAIDKETMMVGFPYKGYYKYIIEEKDHQIEKMKALGINTEGQMFEQMVTSLIQLAESMYTKEQVQKTAFDYYYALSKAMNVPDDKISMDDPQFLEFVANLKKRK